MPVIKRKVGGIIGSKIARKKARAGKKKRKGALPGVDKRVESPINVRQKGDDVASDKIDHRSGVDVDTAKQVGSRGEKVSQGAGDRAMSYTAEQSTKASRKFRKKVAELDTKVRTKNATKAEIKEYEAIRKRDAGDVSRAERAGARTRAAGSRKRIDKKFEDAAEKAYIDTGEIQKHPITKKEYDPPQYIKRRAERNADARKKKPKRRSLEAYLENKKTGGQIKGSLPSRARPKGVGAAQRGWGKTGRH